MGLLLPTFPPEVHTRRRAAPAAWQPVPDQATLTGKQLAERMLHASPVWLAQTCLRGPARAPFHGRFLFGAWHLAVSRIVTTYSRFAMQAPRGVGKSELMSFAYPIWQMTRNRLPDGLLLSSTQDNAKFVLNKIREEIENNPKLQWLYPTGRPGRIWNSEQLTCSNGHTVLSRSVGTKIRGRHPGWVLADDILTDEAKWSEVYRRKVADYWFSVVEPLPTPDGQLGIIGTPMNQGDLLYHDLKHNTEYASFSFPIVDGAGISLWPELFPDAYIAQRRRTMGAHRFSTEMSLQPVSDETSMLPRSLMEGPPQEQLAHTLAAGPDDLAALGLAYFMGVDLAYSTAAEGDYFVIVVLGVDDHENRWLVQLHRERGVPYHRQLSLINEAGRRWNCQRIYIESNQAQRVIGDELLRTTALPIRKFTMTAGKHDLVTGFPSLRRLAEAQKWRIPRGDRASVEATNVLLDELASFTFLRGRVVSVGAHDDTTSALYIANCAALAGRGFHFGASQTAARKPLPGVAGAQVGEIRLQTPVVAAAAPEVKPPGSDGAHLPRLRFR